MNQSEKVATVFATLFKTATITAMIIIIIFSTYNILVTQNPATSNPITPDYRDSDIAKLEDFINTLSWTKPYEKDVFDCSDMSYSLESLLESEGWHTIIVSNKTHMWLLVEIREGYMPVEATGLFVVWWDNPNFNSYFIYDDSWEGET